MSQIDQEGPKIIPRNNFFFQLKMTKRLRKIHQKKSKFKTIFFCPKVIGKVQKSFLDKKGFWMKLKRFGLECGSPYGFSEWTDESRFVHIMLIWVDTSAARLKCVTSPFVVSLPTKDLTSQIDPYRVQHWILLSFLENGWCHLTTEW